MKDDSWIALFRDIRNSGLSLEEARWRWDTQPDLATVYKSLGEFMWSLPNIAAQPMRVYTADKKTANKKKVIGHQVEGGNRLMEGNSTKENK